MRIGSLFSGIGGFDLGFEWAGHQTLWFVENNPYCQAVLAQHWPGIPIYGDITTLDFSILEPVDILIGGFPCQDVSHAGRRAGLKEGTRTGLWYYFAQAIRVLRPRYVVIENVPGLLGLGADIVLANLAEIGYDAEWSIISAASVGAPHRRERVFILAYPHDIRQRNESSEGQRRNLSESSCSETQQRSSDVADTQTRGFQEWPSEKTIQQYANCRGMQNGKYTRKWWHFEPDVGRVAHGIPSRVDRLKSLGNAIVPQVAQEAAKLIDKKERGERRHSSHR